MVDALETRHSPTSVIPNFVVLGLTVLAYVGDLRQLRAHRGPAPFLRDLGVADLRNTFKRHVLSYQIWSL